MSQYAYILVVISLLFLFLVNKYYAHTRILDESPERDSRLALSFATAVVLKEALRLLGVEAPEKM